MSDLFMADDKGWHEPYQKAMDLLLEMKMLRPVKRELYVTTCTNHSGGPASPHTLECFKELDGTGDTNE